MIFLDSSDPNEVAKWLARGTIRGVTTNPTIMKKDGTGEQDIKTIVEMMHPGPVSIEVTSNADCEMVAQARGFQSMGTNVNVKIPIHGPNGEDNLSTITMLSRQYKIPVNVTACMSTQQLLLGALAGARFVSLFGGRVADMGHDVCKAIKDFRAVWKGSITQLILGSVRSVGNVVDWLAAGAQIVTVPPDILERMYTHPRTKETVQQFLTDVGAVENGGSDEL